MAIDAAMGLIPLSTPLESQVVHLPVTSGKTVYKGQIVKNVAGSVEIHPVAATAVDVVGVCMENVTGVADLSVKATICVDPQMIYRCLSDGAVLATDLGFYGDMEDNGGSDTTGLSSGFVDDSAFVAAPSVSLFIQNLGLYDVVTDETNLWMKVRLTQTFYNDRFGLAS